METAVSGPIVFAGIAPHPPLLIPEVGAGRIDRVAASQRSLREFSRRLLDTGPDTVLVISPHSPLDPRAFTARSTDFIAGDFGEFHAPEVSLRFPNDLDLIRAIADECVGEGVELLPHQRDYLLDHGALVPLYYLREAGWRGKTVVVGFTLQTTQKHLAFGRAIAKAAAAINRRLAVVASGDLSHRLIVDGPYEYEPTAHLFDEEIVGAVSDGTADRIIDIAPDLRSRAGECGYRSIVIALGTVDLSLSESEVLSYEGPFGVGYLVAVLADSGSYRASSSKSEN